MSRMAFLVLLCLVYHFGSTQAEGFYTRQEPTCSQECDSRLLILENRLETLASQYSAIIAGKQDAKGRDCAELYQDGAKVSGVYTITPSNGTSLDVYCDMETDGGGWTVFQRRMDGTVNFFRGWEAYKHGFGNLNTEFWLGNEYLYQMTNARRYELRVDMEDVAGSKAYAQYDYFAIGSEKENYKLVVGVYKGTAGDSLSSHNGYAFTTKDKDNDKYSSNCAVRYKGAWWYKACHASNLNGLYHLGAHSYSADGVNWYAFKGHNYSLKKVNMKVRPVDFKSATTFIG